MDQNQSEFLSFVERYEQKTKQYVEPREEKEASTLTVQQDVTAFPAEIQRIRETILETSKHLLYISEGEEPYEFIFIPKEDITELPNDCTQFKSLIKQQQNNNNFMIAEEELSSSDNNNVLSFQEFFDPFISDFAEDPYGQKDGYKELQKIIEATFHGKENVKVYKIGDCRRVGVYLVGIIKGIGIAGLKTFSIET